jgi:FkbM family methyltransferase
VGAIEFSAPKKLIYNIQKKFQYNNFIETGTYMGETSIWASSLFKNVLTIEVNPELSQAAERRANGKKNIRFICGDSSLRLKDISNHITGTSLYWLDGHWCGGVSKLTAECPLMAELNSIISRNEDIILIDDARFFMGVVPQPHNPEEWPRIDQVISLLRIKYPAHEIIIDFDIIMCLPREVFLSVQNDFREGLLKSGENPGRVEFVHANLVRSSLKKIFLFFTSICNSALKYFQTHPTNLRVTSPALPTILDSLSVNTLIDIGASVGDFINQMLERNNKLRVIAFEPVPEIYKALSKRYLSNPNFSAYNIALGDKDGEVEFYANDYTYSSSVLPMSDTHTNEFPYTRNVSLINVAMSRLDTLVEASGLAKPILVKVDVQGFERQVIAGGHNFLTNVDYVIIEVSFVELYQGQPLFDEINVQLNQLGFLYKGNIEQLVSKKTGSILQADALYVRRKEK